MSEFRQDAITGRWAIVAEGRAARPNEYARLPRTAAPPDCPFCEGNESRTPREVAAYRRKGSPADTPGWSVRTIPNKFPTVAPGAVASGEPARAGEVHRPGSGHHEVIIESPSHSAVLASLPIGQAREVFRMLRERLRVLSREPGIRSLVVFENSGPESGGTLFHPHAQVVAIPEIPPLLADELSGVARYAHRHGGVCAFEAEVAREREAAVRLIVDTPKIVAYAPFASSHPYEVRFVPFQHAPSLADATDAEIDQLAELVPRVLRAFGERLPDASYNLVSRALPAGAPEARAYHWHLEIIPRVVRPDGFDLGSGIPVNPVPPEIAAQDLRESIGGGPAPAGRPTTAEH